MVRATTKSGTANIDFGRDEKWEPDNVVVPPRPLDTTLNIGVTVADDGVYVLGEVQNPAGKFWIMLDPDSAEKYAEDWRMMALVARQAQSHNAGPVWRTTHQ